MDNNYNLCSCTNTETHTDENGINFCKTCKLEKEMFKKPINFNKGVKMGGFYYPKVEPKQTVTITFYPKENNKCSGFKIRQQESPVSMIIIVVLLSIFIGLIFYLILM